MGAREELYAALMKGGPHSPDRSEKASHLIDDLLHEEAEKIREDSKSSLVQQGGKFQAGEVHAADLIDPYAN
ncbi:hypothetical protein ABZ154_09215 [Streptomyces sp. NPDC006261]|uniref:hypothetical protein n=1 Tax=Streptomyces sp. NPDC006261 TaxID=3156739 RepID=UPI0033BB81B5